MVDTSRDPNLLSPQLQAAWRYAQEEWVRRYPDEPAPFLTATFRGPIDQAAAARRGSSSHLFGGSLHNFTPAYAFDIAFLRKDGSVDYTFLLYEKMAVEFMEPLGLQWGGRWPRLVDGPHFQLPMDAKDAREGKVPILTKLVELMNKYAKEDAPPEDEAWARKPSPDEWALVITYNGAPKAVHALRGQHVVTRLDTDRKRLYVDVREES